MTGDLLDFVDPGDPSIHQCVLTNIPPVIQDEDIDRLAHMTEPLFAELRLHIRKMKIPGIGEVMVYNPIPDGFPYKFAKIVDEALPHWNIVQKAMQFHCNLQSIYAWAEGYYHKRIIMELRLLNMPKPEATPEEDEQDADRMTKDLINSLFNHNSNETNTGNTQPQQPEED